MPSSTETASGSQPAPAADRAPRRLGPYEVLSELGRGGMGVVLRARDRELDREVAIKFLHAASYQKEHRRLRFVREARVTGRLEHPGIVPVHQLGRDVLGREFFVMKLVAGRTLQRLLESWHAGDRATRRDHPLPRLLAIFERVCETVAFAHAHGVLHRDLKPENISVGAHGEVWVLDWGVAKILDGGDLPLEEEASDERRGLTLEGRVVGTPAYMAPEQARGREIDARADVFSLGGILFHLLAGRAPIPGEGSREIVRLAARGRVLDIGREARARGAPRALVAIVRACLATDPARRYQSVEALLADVRRHLAGEPVSVAPEGPVARLRRWAARHARTVALAGGVAALLLLVATAASLLVASESRQRATALERAARAEEERRGAEAERLGAEARAADAARAADDARAVSADETAKRARAELEAQRATAEKAAAAQRRLRAFTPYAAAMDLVRRGQRLDQAADLARSALQIDGDFVEAAYLLGEALRVQGQPKPAAEAFLRADEASLRILGHHAAPAQLAAALAYELGGYLAESAASYDAVDPEERDPLAEVGRALRDLRLLDLPSAQTRVDALVAAAPHLWEAHYARSRVYAELCEVGLIDPAKAVVECEASARRAVELAPGQPLAHAQLAMCAVRAEDRDAEVARAIALEPANGAWPALRAELRARSGDEAGSRADTETARRLGVAPAALALLAVRHSLATRDIEANFRALGEVASQLAGWPREQMAWAYVGLGLHRDEALPVLRELMAKYPDYPTISLARAAMSTGPRRAEDATAIVRACLARYPWHAQARLAEALYCHLAGHAAESLAAVERIGSGRLTPNDTVLSRRIAIAALTGLGRAGEAEAIRRKAHEEFPSRVAEIDQALR